MTALEMKQAFLIGYDAVASDNSPGWENTEISYWLSKAEHSVAVNYAEEYEKDELVRKRLGKLIVSDFNKAVSSYTGQSDIPSTYYDIPENLMKVVRERFVATSSNKCLEGKLIKVVPVRQDEVEANYKQNPFYTPNEDMVWRLDAYDTANSSRVHQIITGDDYNPDEYGFQYLKYPEGIDIDSETNSILEDALHEEVVDTAVRMATATTKPDMYQITANEETLNSDLNKS